MPDASIRIEGRIVTAPRFGDAKGTPVANLRVIAGRSKKNDQGGWDTLSETAYNIAFWREHHDLIAGLGVNVGDSVVITGNVSGVESYQSDKGERLSVKATGHGIQHFPKRDGGQGGGYQQSAPQQAPQQSYAPQQPAQQGFAQQGWPQAAQPGQGQQPGYGLTDPAPF